MNIIVTGVSSGIGKELCKYLISAEKHTVIGISRSKNDNGKIIENSETEKLSYHHYIMDITNENDVLNFAKWLNNKNIQPHVLINNAGMMVNKPFSGISGEEALDILKVNLVAPFILIKAVVPLMKRNGHIVNITSMGGVMGTIKFPGLSIYSASKGALSILTETLAEELKDTGVKVNALALGAVQTPMLEATFPGYKAHLSPCEMAELIGDFAIKGNKYFNGKILQVATNTP